MTGLPAEVILYDLYRELSDVLFLTYLYMIFVGGNLYDIYFDC